jgi:hypothetical protein
MAIFLVGLYAISLTRKDVHIGNTLSREMGRKKADLLRRKPRLFVDT